MLMSVTFCTHWKNISKGYFCRRISLLQRFRGTSVSLLHSVGYWIGWRHAAVLADSCCPQQYGHTRESLGYFVLVAQTSFLQLQVGSLSTVLSNSVIAEALGQCFHLVEVVSWQKCLKLSMLSVCIQINKDRSCFAYLYMKGL